MKLAKAIIRQCLNTFTTTLCFESIHSAILQPGRLVGWLAACRKLEADEMLLLLGLVRVLGGPTIQDCSPSVPMDAPAVIPAGAWAKGAARLSAEVRWGF